MLVTVMTGLQAQAENWMDRLPDDVFLSVLSVPGAHDAAATMYVARNWSGPSSTIISVI